ncbi:MAG: hypothetical protein MI741_04305, partial [Rhodospirillales bacterium]|nr:hypothetical protein [Rhodospirillales bacterium]
MIDFSAQTRGQLEAMVEAGHRIRECVRVLNKTKDNVVAEVLRHQGEFYEWDHYPKGDVYDWESHSQYYYHAHPIELRGGEHGHFHTFLRPKGMPEGVKPANVADFEAPAEANDALSHLVAFSMDGQGTPIRMFTTNRWVTGETWYTAEDVIQMLDRFEMDLAYPSWPVNIWISSMMRLFRPQIELLLRQRDQSVERWEAEHPGSNVYEDRELEITSMENISVDRQIAETEKALEAV